MKHVTAVDPKLKEAMAEIAVILAKYKIAGAVQLASSTHAEFQFHLPAWSAIQIADKPDKSDIEIRIKSSSKRDGPEHLASSLHMLLSIQDMATAHAGYLQHMAEYVLTTLKEQGVEVDHKSLQEQAQEDAQNPGTPT